MALQELIQASIRIEILTAIICLILQARDDGRGSSKAGNNDSQSCSTLDTDC